MAELTLDAQARLPISRKGDLLGSRSRRRAVYPIVAGLLAFGAPVGYFLLRLIGASQLPTLGWAAHELEAHLGLYAYLTTSTTAVLVVLGRVLGRKEDELVSLSITDALTGLLNRAYFERRLTEEVRRSERYGLPLSLVLFDVDRFKRTNDTRGHHAGDLLLQRIGAVLSGECRATDFVGVRQGGDEFAILLPHTTAREAARFAERLRRDVETKTDATVSMGVAEREDGTEDGAVKLLEAADRALYRAKAAGRNRVVVAERADRGEERPSGSFTPVPPAR
jgi:diguanylate cyclase (GGDEF)-like protein